MQVFKNIVTPTQEQMACFEQIKYRPCPEFLGSFGISYYGHPYGRGKTIPSVLVPIAEHMASFHPEQSFNATFIQHYPTGSYVKPHRDPKSNVGQTLILVLGDFEGAVSHVATYDPVALRHGDMLSLECTIDGVQGPRHQVSSVTRGTRYALILNAVVTI